METKAKLNSNSAAYKMKEAVTAVSRMNRAIIQLGLPRTIRLKLAPSLTAFADAGEKLLLALQSEATAFDLTSGTPQLIVEEEPFDVKALRHVIGRGGLTALINRYSGQPIKMRRGKVVGARGEIGKTRFYALHPADDGMFAEEVGELMERAIKAGS